MGSRMLKIACPKLKIYYKICPKLYYLILWTSKCQLVLTHPAPTIDGLDKLTTGQQLYITLEGDKSDNIYIALPYSYAPMGTWLPGQVIMVLARFSLRAWIIKLVQQPNIAKITSC